MKSREIRRTFLDYFKKHGHAEVASSGLIPENDNTLLFANAGMNQFKNAFLGLEERPYKRATTSQKCVRAGGKHNDLENVGFTARHHTFFEMLGNFSFGDYFKKDAIHFAWELLTKEMEISKDRLYVTVFQDDDEAAEIWHKQEGVPRDRIFRCGEKDNFWRMGDTGPCGPCSEIFFDHGPEADLLRPTKMLDDDTDRFVEIWNNVFMQFNEDGTGRKPLPKPSVDTGGGLERWAAVLQGTYNNFNTDSFTPIIEQACRVAQLPYADLLQLEKQARKTQDEKIKGIARVKIIDDLAAVRVVADHSRAAAFLIADGVLPSNEGRGYVLRRILRRAIRYARKISGDDTLFVSTVEVVIREMKDVYPELDRRSSIILTNVRDEVTRFIHTLDQGTELLENQLRTLSGRGQKTIDGEVVFKLYDTFGFPVDLTRLMAQERGFIVDEAQFEARMDAARAKAKASWKGAALSADAAHLVSLTQTLRNTSGATVFQGYETTASQGRVIKLSDGTKEVQTLQGAGLVILDRTPFYAEGGGQAGDTGVLVKPGLRARVDGCTKQNDVHLLLVEIEEGQIRLGDELNQQVTESSRRATRANHSATHLMHAALRKVLGTHVTQAGSLVDAERLRFDFTHGKPLSPSEIENIEDLVNAEINNAVPVSSGEMGHKEAIASGALALFGEKYGDRVRVIKMGDFSTELCGGTHVANTSEIRLFKIVSESGVSSGVRRIEALTSDHAFQFMRKHLNQNMAARTAVGLHENWMTFVSAATSGDTKLATVVDWIEQSRQQIKDLEREIKSLKGGAIDLDSFFKNAKPFSIDGKSGHLVCAFIEVDDRKLLAELTDKLKDKVQSGVVVVVGKGERSHPVIVTVTKDHAGAKLNAGKILGEVAAILKGKGGGRPDFAQGAGEDLTQLNAAFAKAASLVGA